MAKYGVAVVRRPVPNFAQGVTTAGLGPPDYDLALLQHERYCDFLRDRGLQVIYLEPDIRYPDGCFVEDTAIVINECSIITNLGHPSRRGEQAAIEEFLATTSKRVEHIQDPGTLEGGDVLRVGSHFFIGLTERTNAAGAAQLTALLKSLDMSASTVKIEELLHLKTGVTSIAADTLVCVSELAQHSAFSQIKYKIVVRPAEAPAANCLSVNGEVLVPSDCEITQQAIERAGKRVSVVCMSEFQKMDGGLTCLSLLFPDDSLRQ